LSKEQQQKISKLERSVVQLEKDYDFDSKKWALQAREAF
jgi:hypothetical protein